MNRTDRLLAIVLELQAKGWLRAEDLAATFEVSKRTVYRDMQALAESGVPVMSSPGQGYSLMEGYFLPPLSFTQEEALMLLLGGDFMAQTFDAEYQRAARAATSKIAAVLNEEQREALKSLENAMRFVASTFDFTLNPEMLQRIRRAVIQSRTVRFEYHARHTEDVGGEKTLREADPYAILHWDRYWYLIAYCHLRKAVRIFRLDRIDQLEVLNRTFQRPPDFKITNRLDDFDMRVRILFDLSVERWIREDGDFYALDYQHTPDGLLVTYRVRREDDVFRWLMGYAAYARVIEPDSLRERIVNEAKAILERNGVAVAE
jgi:predicted DNA-binding transcriptional regulator YafY